MSAMSAYEQSILNALDQVAAMHQARVVPGAGPECVSCVDEDGEPASWPCASKGLLEGLSGRVRAVMVARDNAEDAAAQMAVRALAAIEAIPRRSGTPEWSKAAAVGQAAGFDVGLARAADAVRAALAGEVPR